MQSLFRYYFGARYYDARVSVWVSCDPILGDYLPTGDKERDKKLPGMGGVFNSFNLGLYSYSCLNPVKFIDPDGNQAVKIPEIGDTITTDWALELCNYYGFNDLSDLIKPAIEEILFESPDVLYDIAGKTLEAKDVIIGKLAPELYLTELGVNWTNALPKLNNEQLFALRDVEPVAKLREFLYDMTNSTPA